MRARIDRSDDIQEGRCNFLRQYSDNAQAAAVATHHVTRESIVEVEVNPHHRCGAEGAVTSAPAGVSCCLDGAYTPDTASRLHNALRINLNVTGEVSIPNLLPSSRIHTLNGSSHWW